MRFADEAVRKAALAELGVDEIENEAQLTEIENLGVTGARNLDDLPRFPALKSLRLTTCDLDNALPLRRMRTLSSLELRVVTGVTAHDIAPLTGLEYLWINGCGEIDIEPLAALTHMKNLTIWDAGIRDLSPLKGMTRMVDLSLLHNPIEDISPLRGMKRLERLSLDTKYLKDRRIFLEKPFSTAYEFCADFPENAPESAKKKKPRGREKLTYLANVHPRLPFCRDAALFRLAGGKERLVCRDYGKPIYNERYDLYLDDKQLAEISINSRSEFSCHFRRGYGDGLINEQPCLAVRDEINLGFESMKHVEKLLTPYIGLMESGLYVVADFEMFPVKNDGSTEYFWDCPEYCEELHFIHTYVSGGTLELDTPLFLAPTIRPANMNPERVEYYRARLGEGEKFPRAIALYLNGGVALLLDGHHKAAACAMEGRRVRTLVIFPMMDIDSRAVEKAAVEGTRLYLQRKDRFSRPSVLCDGKERVFGWTSCLEHMKKTRVYAEPLTPPEWGLVPDEFRTEHFKDYPDLCSIENGCRQNPQEVRRMIADMKDYSPKQKTAPIVSHIWAYADLFPESKWLTAEERAWLNRPEDTSELGYTVEYPEDPK